MIRTTLILAALAATSNAHALYRLKDPALACESVSALRDAALAIRDAKDDNEALGLFDRLTNDGRCVLLSGNYIIMEGKSGRIVSFTTGSDPRTLYTFDFWIDWNQTR